ncbi:MAG: Aspartyl/glutamyl-tRNA(Asn/Gln) amidotransferase subunit B [Parcubacteria group bacterium GW2011_GWC2_39_14]|nr:MAG: Aspartyl/glutamyl-tRNA(Asn/Gln) amidotransferase subunit B [Parcubacteria group bacterium GW2011_GWC2_39_14]KKR53145.1 MAG: Aspartyl/glutamyl-tRNA(Asn/Gln) amidotransferase subunit B [Parcubacteria group bacterium GW2011_GWA2_40_23]
MKLETIIGLEFHVQLKTKTKMFCACSNEIEAKDPNVNICPICLGHPGILPTINEEAVHMGMKAALALNCTIANFTKFDRKNYFYPDLPKGYQISQYDKPLALDGSLVINWETRDGLAGSLTDENQLKRIGIVRLHLEEDAAKSTHINDGTLIDYNRGGAPLIEIVTHPHLSSPQEAKTFGQEIQLIMRHLNISDADMEKGQLRCDGNISLRPVGDKKLYPKTELKNINSFRALERALAYEIERQTLLWHAGTPPTKEETRGWDEATQTTISQRVKEGESDYRYFPEPDLPPIIITEDEIQALKIEIPELPQDKRRRFVDMYDFTGEEAKILADSKQLANFTEKVISELKSWLEDLDTISGNKEEIWETNKHKLIKLVSNWLINKYLPALSEQNISFKSSKITAENFAEFICLVYESKVNSSAAQAILKRMIETGGDPSHLIEDMDLVQMSGSDELGIIIEKTLAQFPDQVAEYKSGKTVVIKYFLGLIMRETNGKADPQETEKLLQEYLAQ